MCFINIAVSVKITVVSVSFLCITNSPKFRAINNKCLLSLLTLWADGALLLVWVVGWGPTAYDGLTYQPGDSAGMAGLLGPLPRCFPFSRGLAQAASSSAE